MPQTIKVIGYHGTSKDIATSILAPGAEPRSRFLSGQTKSDWLGDGAYFFQDAPYHAREWPMFRMPERTRIKDPVVICAEIDLTENCLDLLDIRDSRYISDEYVKIKADYDRRKRSLPENKGPNRRFDCALVNFAVKEIEKSGKRIDTIRAAFTEGEPIVPGSQIYSHAHVQVVVRPGRNHVIGNVWLYELEKGDNL